MRAHPSSFGPDAARVLMVAFQFPPFAMSSGVQRTLRFVQHLPALGWQPIVLSANARAYPAVSTDLMADIPPEVVVERAFALDTARHLAVAGRYPEFLARPDRWRTWAFRAIAAGLRLIEKYRPRIIWSTYPIATAHLIAHRLHRLTGLPLVADFRDLMVQIGYPADPRTMKSFVRIEQDVVRDAKRLVFVTAGALADYRARYPSTPVDRFAVIENGYDEEAFLTAERGLQPAALNPGCFTLLHSGIVYPSERDPRALFDVLARLKREGRIDAGSLRLRFRAPAHDELLAQLARRTQTADLIEILPAIPYDQALREMLQADGLLVMQGANCNAQIPAKLYEYFRARRPILGLADPDGDTGQAMLRAGVKHVACLEEPAKLEVALSGYLSAVRSSPPDRPPASLQISDMSRRARSRQLADLFDAVAGTHAGGRIARMGA